MYAVAMKLKVSVSWPIRRRCGLVLPEFGNPVLSGRLLLRGGSLAAGSLRQRLIGAVHRKLTCSQFQIPFADTYRL